jgi:hypothetical protein
MAGAYEDPGAARRSEGGKEIITDKNRGALRGKEEKNGVGSYRDPGAGRWFEADQRTGRAEKPGFSWGSDAAAFEEDGRREGRKETVVADRAKRNDPGPKKRGRKNAPRRGKDERDDPRDDSRNDPRKGPRKGPRRER